MKRKNSFLIILGIFIVIGIFIFAYSNFIAKNMWILKGMQNSNWIYLLLFFIIVISALILWYEKNYIKKLKVVIKEIEWDREKKDNLFKRKMSYLSTYINNLERKIKNLENLKRERTSPPEINTDKLSILLDSSLSVFEKINSSIKSIKEDIKRLNDHFLEIKNILIEYEGPIKRNFDNMTSAQEKLDDIRGVLELVKKTMGQIRLIAFNAAIESSRSHSENRGFSVIASQIKNLVDEIEETTNEIEGTINDLEGVFSEGVLISEVLLKKQDKIILVNNTISDLMNVLSDSVQNIYNLNQDLERFYENHREVINEFKETIQWVEAAKVRSKEENLRYKEYIKELLMLTRDIKKSIESDVDE